MNGDLWLWLFVCAMIPILVMLAQILVNWFSQHTSPQFNALLSIGLSSLPYLLVIRFLAFSSKDEPGFYLYALLLYLFISYTYFHFFNMSETSRRIRMLFSLTSTKELQEPHQLGEIFDQRTMIQTRLDRLVALGQLSKVGDLYFSRSMIFSLTARTLYEISCLLGKPWRDLQPFIEQKREHDLQP